MTIETGSAQNTSRPTSSADGHHARGKAGASDTHGHGASGGFMAILASLDDSSATVATVLTATDSISQALFSGDDLFAIAEKDADGLMGIGIDDGANRALDATAALDDALAKLLQGPESEGAAKNDPKLVDATAAGLPTASDLNLLAEILPQTAALLAQSQQWSASPTAKTGNCNPDLTTVPALSLISGVKASPAIDPQQRALPEGDMASESASEAIAGTGKLQKDATAKLSSLHAALATPPDAAEKPDPRATTSFAARVAEQPLTPLATALTMAIVSVPVRRVESSREHSIFRTTVPEGGAVAQTYAPTTQATQAPGAVEPPTPTDFYVAEKVAYWMSNDVQNAELKLDGIGRDPVEVSIRMHGNEAHIAFRSDEALARSALESASTHLKDLLQREGLVLTGVSVGTSGSGDSERKSRQGMRQSVVVSQQSNVADRMVGGSRLTRGALDLFV